MLINLFGFTVSVFWAFFVLMIWIAIAFLPARIAASKGHSFLAYFLLSVFFWPITLIVALMAPDRLSVDSHVE